MSVPIILLPVVFECPAQQHPLVLNIVVGLKEFTFLNQHSVWFFIFYLFICGFYWNLTSTPLGVDHHFRSFGRGHTQSPQMPAGLITESEVQLSYLKYGEGWRACDGPVRGAYVQREESVGRRLALVPWVLSRYLEWVIAFGSPFFTWKSGPRKVGELAESLSLESQELAFRCLSWSPCACPALSCISTTPRLGHFQ